MKRLYSMDAIRVLAMALVIIVHTKHYFFSPSAHSSLFFILKILGTAGVPLFVVLTGYLMFDRDYEDNSYLSIYLIVFSLFLLLTNFGMSSGISYAIRT